MPRPPITINNAACYDGYAVKHELYYDLVKVVYKDMTVYIPATKFLTFKRFWVVQSAPREGARHDAFFRCPICLTTSFFFGPCRQCKSDWNLAHAIKLRNWNVRNKRNMARQFEFLRELDIMTENPSFSALKGVVRVGYIFYSRNVETLINKRLDRPTNSLDEFLLKRDLESSDLV